MRPGQGDQLCLKRVIAEDDAARTPASLHRLEHADLLIEHQLCHRQAARAIDSRLAVDEAAATTLPRPLNEGARLHQMPLEDWIALLVIGLDLQVVAACQRRSRIGATVTACNV